MKKIWYFIKYQSLQPTSFDHELRDYGGPGQEGINHLHLLSQGRTRSILIASSPFYLKFYEYTVQSINLSSGKHALFFWLCKQADWIWHGKITGIDTQGMSKKIPHTWCHVLLHGAQTTEASWWWGDCTLGRLQQFSGCKASTCILRPCRRRLVEWLWFPSAGTSDTERSHPCGIA